MNLGLVLTLGFIGLFIFGIWAYWRWINYDHKFWTGFFFFVWLVGCFATPLATYNSYESSLEYTSEEHEFYIYSLGNDKYTEGSFILGSGSIDQKDYYFFFVNYTVGMHREKLPVSEVYLIEGDYDRPAVKGVYRKYKDDGKFWKIMDDLEPRYYKAYVPRGTIVKEFRVR